MCSVKKWQQQLSKKRALTQFTLAEFDSMAGRMRVVRITIQFVPLPIVFHTAHTLQEFKKAEATSEQQRTRTPRQIATHTTSSICGKWKRHAEPHTQRKRGLSVHLGNNTCTPGEQGIEIRPDNEGFQESGAHRSSGSTRETDPTAWLWHRQCESGGHPTIGSTLRP